MVWRQSPKSMSGASHYFQIGFKWCSNYCILHFGPNSRGLSSKKEYCMRSYSGNCKKKTLLSETGNLKMLWLGQQECIKKMTDQRTAHKTRTSHPSPPQTLKNRLIALSLSTNQHYQNTQKPSNEQARNKPTWNTHLFITPTTKTWFWPIKSWLSHTPGK